MQSNTPKPLKEILAQIESTAHTRNVLCEVSADGSFAMRCKNLCQVHSGQTASPLLRGKAVETPQGTVLSYEFKPPMAVYLFLGTSCAIFMTAGVLGRFVMHHDQFLPASVLAAVALLVWYRTGGIKLCPKEQEHMQEIVRTAIEVTPSLF